MIITHRALIFIGIMAIAGTATAQKDKKITESTVTKSGVEAKVHFLASDELKGRDTPSEGLDVAARYIATNLMQYGVKPVAESGSFLQPVNMVLSSTPTDGKFAVGDSIFDFERDMVKLSGGPASMTGELIFLGYGEEADFAGADLEGKIVITKAGTKGESSARKAFGAGVDKAALAKAGGAKALIELYSFPQPTWKLLQFYLNSPRVALDMGGEEENDDDSFPRIWLEDTGNDKAAFLSDFNGSAALSVVSSPTVKFVTHNVVGMVEGTDPKLKDEYVIYSAHYDHVGIGEANSEGDSIYNGTRDNAIGSMTVLEAAQNIAKNPTKRSALFIFFTGEEKGLLGSEWYTEHPLVPMEKVVYCFNSDNAGYDDTGVVTIVGLSRTSAAEDIKKAVEAFGLQPIDDPVPDQNLFDRSDHVNFARQGVPALMFSLGLTEFGDEILKYYHQAADNPESVDYDYLYKFTQSYVYACRLIANAKEAPFWVPGDKYEEAGKALYGM